jgi:multiple sugar transport system substrate-binding protein
METKKMETKKVDWFLFGLAIVVLGAVFLTTLNFLPDQLKAPGKTTLVFTQWWRDELEEGALESIIRDYEALTPGVTIILTHKPYEAMAGELFRREDGEPPPDIIGLDSRLLQDLIRQEQLESLESYKLKEMGFERGQVFSGDGEYEQWAVPLIAFMPLLFYNTALLEAAGFDRPPKTREDFLAYARALTDPAAGRYGTVLSLSPAPPQGLYGDVFSWIWASGAGLSPGGAPDFSGPAVIDTFSFFNQLHQEGTLAPSLFSKTGDEKREDFMEGRAAMMVGSISEINRIMKGNAALDFGVSTIPSSDKYPGRPVLGLAGWYAGINRESRHKDDAWDFLAFLNGRRSFLAAVAHAVPDGQSGSAEITGENPLYAKAYDIYTAGEAADLSAGIPGLAGMETILWEELKAMFEGKSGPEETGQSLQRRLELLERKNP